MNKFTFLKGPAALHFYGLFHINERGRPIHFYGLFHIYGFTFMDSFVPCEPFLPSLAVRRTIGPYGSDRETEGASARLHFLKIYDIILKKGSRKGASSMFNGFDFYKKFYYNYNGGKFFFIKKIFHVNIRYP